MQKSDYQPKPNEEGYVHVRFTRIVRGKGKRTSDVHSVQKYSVKEFVAFQKFVEKNGMAGVTQQDEVEVIWDPRLKKAAVKKAVKKVEPVVVEPEDPIKKEADEIRSYLTEKGVAFHQKLGIVKLRELYELNKE